MVVPGIDSIGAFRISTSNYGADVGKRGSAITEIATKSGTKDFHGTAFEFLRNDAMNERRGTCQPDPWARMPGSKLLELARRQFRSLALA